MELSKLAPKPGARKNRIRVGRGEGAGRGKTCGRGEKGQGARSGGGVRAGFEGGQMPLYRRLPKWGFTSKQQLSGRNQYNTVSLAVLERHFVDGDTVDVDALRKVGYGKNPNFKAGVKILGSGTLSKKLTVRVEAVTAGARKQIEAAGGTIELLADVQPAQAATEE